MIKKKEFYYDSRDQKTKIHAVKWEPDEEIRYVLQIAHGMCEYIERYEDLALYLAERGILVVGNDHLGHGKSAPKAEDKGYFCDGDGALILVRDVHRLKKITQQEYPGKPYFILGHSMGSFITRNYLCRYGRGIDGAVIVGTGRKSTPELLSGKAFADLLALFFGWRHKSRLIDNIAFGMANRKIPSPRTRKDWLTRDPAVVDQFIADPNCNFLFTLNGFHELFQLILNLNRDENLRKMPKDLPVAFFAGSEDPIGDYGKGVRRVFSQFQELDMQDVEIKLYDGCRHEILIGPDKHIIFRDIYKWLEERYRRLP